MSLPNAARDPGLEAELARHLDGWTIYAFQRVGSTMEIAHQLAADGATEGTLVWAARQERGRGRLGRTWESPEGGIYLSLIVCPTRPAAEIPQLSLVTGLATAEAIQHLTGLFPSIRWPNDLLLHGLKVAGILTETRSSSNTLSAIRSTLYAVIGIGINVTTRTEELPDSATSLLANLSEPSHFSPLTSHLAYSLTGVLCSRFRAWYDVWTTQGFAPIREALRPWIGLFGHPVHISAGADHFEGTASDLDEAGRLLVRLDSGVMRQFEMGEVTLLR
ncbi:MAG: biotin--[acetyl-CoA-carboxylase] ligase [Candidatus Omnitrophica bacterium]|nr:biotin--[acetyl-CoA-carboxylase] ligase [Candidatus Omnitrophota bacterium]